MRPLHALGPPEGMGDQGRDDREAGQHARAQPAERRPRRAPIRRGWVRIVAAATNAGAPRPRAAASATAPGQSASLARPLVRKGAASARRASQPVPGQSMTDWIGPGADVLTVSRPDGSRRYSRRGSAPSPPAGHQPAWTGTRISTPRRARLAERGGEVRHRIAGHVAPIGPGQCAVGDVHDHAAIAGFDLHPAIALAQQADLGARRGAIVGEHRALGEAESSGSMNRSAASAVR